MMQIDFGESMFWIAYSVSNIGGALMALTAWKLPRLSRLMYVGLFGWACWFNIMNATSDPKSYLDYAYFAVFSVYQQFILGWFSEHIALVVSCVAVYQGLISLGMLLGGKYQRLSSLMAITFLMAVSPLGLGSAFPAPIFMALGAYLHFRNRGVALWQKR